MSKNIKISKAAKDLNVSAQTIRDYLKKKGRELPDEGPNARIPIEDYEILVKEYRPDMVQKQDADAATKERQREKAKLAAETEKRTESESIKLNENETEQESAHAEPDYKTEEQPIEQKQTGEESGKKKSEGKKLKIIGQIDIKTGKPISDSKESAQQQHDDKAQDEQPSAGKEADNESLASVNGKEQSSQPSTDDGTKVEPKPEYPQPQDGNDETIDNDEDETIDIYEPSRPELKGPKVVGKVNLDNLNTKTRPQKKTKEERRKEREEEGKKKRKRIGKEKIDIEKANQFPQVSANGGKGQKNQSTSKKDKKLRRPLKPEVNEEDVQRQVKETLARLTTKTQNKGAKFRRDKRNAVREEERAEKEAQAAEQKVLKLTEFVTANDLASMMNIPINKVIGTCLNLGVMVSINQRLDAETINIVAEEFGFSTEYESAEVVEAIHEEEDNPEDLQDRPPVVTVMGHVDHGKTSLLDYIRNSNVIAGEAGGITQHIGAYNVKLPNGRRITFLDTPGHEAFTAMRARGAKVTDIVIVIVAADDAVMPQTVEALNHASAAGVPIVFAINKIDKPGANPDKIKEELAGMNYLVEEWGGKFQSQDISAKKGMGVQELMDKVLLEADLLDLKANPNRKATGSIIESSLDKGRGYVATVLVDNGTLHVGDIMLAGTHYGKVKAMFNERNQRITEAGPSTPVLILGLNGAPTAGDKFNIMDTDQEARQIANKREQLQRELTERTMHRRGLDDIARLKALGEFHELNIIVKGDVDGSIEALSDSLIKLSTPEVEVKVIHKAVGAITESDVTLAAASDAYIIGFQVRPSADAKRLAEREGVDIRLYSIIYDAIEEVKSAMEGMLSPDIKEEVSGSAEVKEVFHISKVGTIAGAIVREGKIKRTCKVRVIRDGIVIYTGNLGSLKRFKDDVKEVGTNTECGISIQSYNDLVVGDIIEAFEEIEVQKTL